MPGSQQQILGEGGSIPLPSILRNNFLLTYLKMNKLIIIEYKPHRQARI